MMSLPLGLGAVFIFFYWSGRLVEGCLGKRLTQLTGKDEVSLAGGKAGKLGRLFPELLEVNVSFNDALFGAWFTITYYIYFVVVVADMSVFDCSKNNGGE